MSRDCHKSRLAKSRRRPRVGGLRGPAAPDAPITDGRTVLFDLRPVKEKPPGGGFSIHRVKPFLRQISISVAMLERTHVV